MDAAQMYLDGQIFSPQSHLCMDGRILHGIAVQLHGGTHGVLQQ